MLEPELTNVVYAMPKPNSGKRTRGECVNNVQRRTCSYLASCTMLFLFTKYIYTFFLHLYG